MILFTPTLQRFVALLLGILASLFLFKRLRDRAAIDDKIKKDGILAQGSIANRRKGIRTFELIYTYEVRGKIYSQIQRVDEETFKRIDLDESVVVCYLPTNLEKSVLHVIPVAYLEFQIFFATTIIVLIYGLINLVIAIIALLVTFVHI